jgi:phosphonate transport system substrate-binding protein
MKSFLSLMNNNKEGLVMQAIKTITQINTLTVALIGIFLVGVPLASHAEDQLKFGVYTADKPTEVVKMFRPILNTIEKGLEEKLGKPIKISIQVANSYEKGIDDIVEGRVDFSRFGPASYVEAKRRNPQLSLLAIESKKGEKVFYGIICVHQDSLIQDFKDFKGKSFAFGNELSTIGRYLSQNVLLESNIKAVDLSHYEYLGRHDKVGEAVGSGQFDGGALKESTFNKLVKKGVPIRSIAKFPNVTKPWIARSDMSQELREALTGVLLDIKDPVVLKSLKKDGFLKGEDKDYEGIRQSIEVNSEFFE